VNTNDVVGMAVRGIVELAMEIANVSTIFLVFPNLHISIVILKREIIKEKKIVKLIFI
jgi:hypothetical protein